MYNQYFIVKYTQALGHRVTSNDAAAHEYIFGGCFWVLHPTAAMTAQEALGQYRERNDMQLHFTIAKCTSWTLGV